MPIVLSTRSRSVPVAIGAEVRENSGTCRTPHTSPISPGGSVIGMSS